MDEETTYQTPTQGRSSGDTTISPQGLEAAEILSKTLSQSHKKRKLRKKLLTEEGKSVEGVKSASDDPVKSASKKLKSDDQVSSGDQDMSADIQRKGKQAFQEPSQPKKTKKQLIEEQTSLAEIARIHAEEAQIVA